METETKESDIVILLMLFTQILECAVRVNGILYYIASMIGQVMAGSDPISASKRATTSKLMASTTASRFPSTTAGISPLKAVSAKLLSSLRL